MAYDPTMVSDLSLTTPVSDYMQANLPDVLGLISSGAARIQFNDVAEMGGNTISLRFWKEDTTADELDDGSASEGFPLSSRTDIAFITRRRRHRPIDNATRSALGTANADGVINELSRQSAYYWQKRIEANLVQLVAAQFDASNGVLRSVLKNAIGVASGSIVTASYSAMVDTAKLVGDNMESLAVILAPSKVWADLKKEAGSKIDYQYITDNAGATIVDELGQPVRARFYDGKRVILTDQFPTTGSGSYKKYLTVLCKPGCMAVAFQRQVETFIDRVAERNATWLTQSVAFAPHLMGVKFSGTPSDTNSGPTLTEFGTATNYTATYGNVKDVGLAVLESNASA